MNGLFLLLFTGTFGSIIAGNWTLNNHLNDTSVYENHLLGGAPSFYTGNTGKALLIYSTIQYYAPRILAYSEISNLTLTAWIKPYFGWVNKGCNYTIMEMGNTSSVFDMRIAIVNNTLTIFVGGETFEVDPPTSGWTASFHSMRIDFFGALGKINVTFEDDIVHEFTASGPFNVTGTGYQFMIGANPESITVTCSYLLEDIILERDNSIPAPETEIPVLPPTDIGSQSGNLLVIWLIPVLVICIAFFVYCCTKTTN